MEDKGWAHHHIGCPASSSPNAAYNKNWPQYGNQPSPIPLIEEVGGQFTECGYGMDVADEHCTTHGFTSGTYGNTVSLSHAGINTLGNPTAAAGNPPFYSWYPGALMGSISPNPMFVGNGRDVSCCIPKRDSNEFQEQ